MSQFVPHWLEEVIYPIDKVNLDVLRFAHFLALAVVTVWFVPRDWPPLKSWWAWPPIVCGQHSLEIFCLGVFLSFAAHFAMVEMSGAFWMQVLVSVLGILIMIAAAVLITWYKKDRRTKSRIASAENAGRRPRGRRGMRTLIAARRCGRVVCARRHRASLRSSRRARFPAICCLETMS